MPQIEIEVVSYANSQFLLEVALEAEDSTTVDSMFLSEELARKAAIELAKDFKWVQISEWGEWNNHKGHPQSGWIAFWWTDACGYNGSPPEKSGNIGVPDGQITLRRYSTAKRPENK